MKLTLVLLSIIALAITLVYMRHRNPFKALYRKGLRCENNRDYAGAIEAYELILEQNKQLTFKDKALAREAENRLKTLRSEVYYEKGFLMEYPLNRQEDKLHGLTI